MLKFITYVIVIFIMMAFFGFQSGIVEIKNPNRVPYDKTKYWSVED
jgi:hypothetical protein